jgi:hypothetical protein
MENEPTVINIQERAENLIKGMATILSFSEYHKLKSDETESDEFDRVMGTTGIGEKLEKIMIEELTQKGLTAEA